MNNDVFAPRCLMIQPYFGELPPYFPAHLVSCKFNKGIDWLFLGDHLENFESDNVRFVSMSFDDLTSLARKKLGWKDTISNPYKICDLRPAFAVVFEDYLKEYEFWGHCDLDVVWGDINRFVTRKTLKAYDVISGSYKVIRGHFVLYRNISHVNQLYRTIPQFEKRLADAKSWALDEKAMTIAVRAAAGAGRVSAFWDKWLFNYKVPNRFVWPGPSITPPVQNRWRWKNGRLFHGQDEIMYLHFMNWKKTLHHCSFTRHDKVEQFSISFSDINHRKKPVATAIIVKAYLTLLKPTTIVQTGVVILWALRGFRWKPIDRPWPY